MKLRTIRTAIFTAFGIMPALGANLTPAWVELGSAGAVARVILDADSDCPRIKLDGRSLAMRTRVDNPSASFPLTVCEAAIPKTVKSASIDLPSGPQQLALPVANPRRIVVIGDTGCRVKDVTQLPPAERKSEGKSDFQDCEDPAKWPFKQVAGAAASEKPDLVIHVGDYLYRETPCPDASKCGTVYGYDWPAWNADFFAPAAALLQAAPWIFVRGNHENCGRAWQGFYFFLDPRELAQLGACGTPYTDPYVVKLGKQHFGVLDSALANDTKASKHEVKEYAKELRSLVDQGMEKGWLLTHRPPWGLRTSADGAISVNLTLQAAWQKAQIKRSDVSLVVAGHVHLFELLSFQKQSGLPPQLVVGDSGTKLAKALPKHLAGTKVANSTITSADSFDSFSYGLMTRETAGWRLRMRDESQSNKADCELDLDAGTASCR